jgi:hypothetical protein
MLPDFGFMQSPSYAEKHDEMSRPKTFETRRKGGSGGMELEIDTQTPVQFQQMNADQGINLQ